MMKGQIQGSVPSVPAEHEVEMRGVRPLLLANVLTTFGLPPPMIKAAPRVTNTPPKKIMVLCLENSLVEWGGGVFIVIAERVSLPQA